MKDRDDGEIHKSETSSRFTQRQMDSMCRHRIEDRMHRQIGRDDRFRVHEVYAIAYSRIACPCSHSEALGKERDEES